MRYLIIAIVCVVSAVVIASVGLVNAQEKQSDFESAIRQSDEDFVKYTEAKNWDALAMLYTEDCVVMPPGAPMVFGRDAAKALFEPLTVTNFTLTTQEAQARGDLGYSRGTYVWTVQIGDSEPMTEKGKWVVVWKRVNGQWLLHQDIWNSDGVGE